MQPLQSLDLLHSKALSSIPVLSVHVSTHLASYRRHMFAEFTSCAAREHKTVQYNSELKEM